MQHNHQCLDPQRSTSENDPYMLGGVHDNNGLPSQDITIDYRYYCSATRRHMKCAPGPRKLSLFNEKQFRLRSQGPKDRQRVPKAGAAQQQATRRRQVRRGEWVHLRALVQFRLKSQGPKDRQRVPKAGAAQQPATRRRQVRRGDEYTCGCSYSSCCTGAEYTYKVVLLYQRKSWVPESGTNGAWT